jgi:hypothetical protein
MLLGATTTSALCKNQRADKPHTPSYLVHFPASDIPDDAVIMVVGEITVGGKSSRSHPFRFSLHFLHRNTLRLSESSKGVADEPNMQERSQIEVQIFSRLLCDSPVIFESIAEYGQAAMNLATEVWGHPDSVC